jgi:Spy/CpxP family protein refolding chaperone
MSSKALVFAMVILAAATVASAFEESGSQTGKAGARTAEERLEEFSKKLDLNDDQKAQVKTILESAQGEMKELREAEGSRREKGSRLRELGKETNGKIRAVLNDEQKKKFDELVEQKKSEMRERRRRS